MNFQSQPTGPFTSTTAYPSNTGAPNVFTSTAANIGSTLSNTASNLSQSVATSVNQFSQQAEAGIGASSSFLESNTLIAKFAFLILAIIVFLFLLNLGITLIQYFSAPSDSPYLVKGMIDGTTSMIIPQDPAQSDSILIKRSNNESSGIEFTWSTWIYVNELNSGTNYIRHQHIFSKGNASFDDMGIADVNNAPGLYLKQNVSNTSNSANTASLHVIMNTNTQKRSDTLVINDIPLKKWVNVIIRMQNTIMDVYINGIVSGRLNLDAVPMQNFHDVLVCQNGGFNGKVSNLRYYAEALNIFEITKIVGDGPDTTTSQAQAETPDNYSYLSRMWYTAKL
jgi:hypothetical protein